MTSSITGIVGRLVKHVSLSNVRISAKGNTLAVPIQVPEAIATYPEADMFGRLPAYGLFCRHVEDLRVCDVYLSTNIGDERPALVADDVSGFDLTGFRGEPPARDQPVVHITNARHVFVHGCRALVGTGAFVRLSGEKTEKVQVLANDLSEAGVAFVLDDNVDKNALTESANALPRA